MTPEKPFMDALGDLLADYADLDIEQIIADMETCLDGLYNDLMNKDDGHDDGS